MADATAEAAPGGAPAAAAVDKAAAPDVEAPAAASDIKPQLSKAQSMFAPMHRSDEAQHGHGVGRRLAWALGALLVAGLWTMSIVLAWAYSKRNSSPAPAPVAVVSAPNPWRARASQEPPRPLTTLPRAF